MTKERKHSRHENVRDSRVRLRLECRAESCPESTRASRLDSQWHARRERPLWNAPGVNLRGRVGGRSRLAHGTIRRLGRQKAPPSPVRRRCADACKVLGPRPVTRVRSRFCSAIVRCCRLSILLCSGKIVPRVIFLSIFPCWTGTRSEVTLAPWVNVTLNVTLQPSSSTQAAAAPIRQFEAVLSSRYTSMPLAVIELGRGGRLPSGNNHERCCAAYSSADARDRDTRR